VITINVLDTELDFEHSLVSLSEWEAHYEKPFYPPKGTEDTKTQEQLEKYFEFMFIGPRDQRHKIMAMTPEQQTAVAHYIGKTRTATTIKEIASRGQGENVTSELIYYWLVAFKIPFQPTERWHLNRLLTLVRVCSAKQAPTPKGRQSKAKMAQTMREMNEQRRAQMGTSG
jgi:hypothetical protein